MEQKDASCLTIMKTLGNRSNIFSFFHKTSHLLASRTSCKTKDKYLGHLPLELTNRPKAVFSTAPP